MRKPMDGSHLFAMETNFKLMKGLFHTTLESYCTISMLEITVGS